MAKKQHADDFRPYGGLTRRRKVLVAVLAVATAVVVVLALLDPPGASRQPRRTPAPDTARCEPGKDRGCVGGPTEVLRPAAPAASG